MSKLNVVQILWNLGRAGAERMVFDLSRYLKTSGHRVSVIAASGGGPMEDDFASAGIDLTILPPTHMALRFALVKKMEARLKEICPDIVHTHLGGDVWGGKAAKALDLSWVLTAHSQEGDMKFHQRFGRRWAYAHVDHVAAVSKNVSIEIQSRHHLDQNKLSIIPVGLDLARFKPRSARLPSDAPRIVSVGRLVSLKGHDVLLRALSRIKTPWRLDLIGNGPEYLSLNRLAESLGILPRVRFLGEVEDVAPYLEAADLFCFPSRHEGQGLALFEAAAARLPIITSKLPAIEERFDQSMMTMIPPGDIDAWSKGISGMLLDYGRSMHMAERAYREVATHYTIEAMGEAYVALYRSLISKP
jgi:glycosyltransferase involved in cell wall biosynthesis